MDELATLRRIRWSPGGSEASLLVKHGFVHGFTGVGGTPPDPARHFARQVHGIRIVEATEAGNGPDVAAERRDVADGVMTRAPGVSVAVKTADCVPILIAALGPAPFAVAVHAGWRGLTAGIIASAVGQARAGGVEPLDLVAAIGPAISRESFEVGEEVVEALLSEAGGLGRAAALLCLSKGQRDRWHVDLAAASALVLARQGLTPERIEVLQACTYRSPTLWHSARREGPGFGSNWSWIQI